MKPRWQRLKQKEVAVSSRIHFCVFDGEDGNQHFAPCLEDGSLIGGHVLSELCFCHPIQDFVEPTLLVHNDQRETLH